MLQIVELKAETDKNKIFKQICFGEKEIYEAGQLNNNNN